MKFFNRIAPATLACNIASAVEPNRCGVSDAFRTAFANGQAGVKGVAWINLQLSAGVSANQTGLIHAGSDANGVKGTVMDVLNDFVGPMKAPKPTSNYLKDLETWLDVFKYENPGHDNWTMADFLAGATTYCNSLATEHSCGHHRNFWSVKANGEHYAETLFRAPQKPSQMVSLCSWTAPPAGRCQADVQVFQTRVQGWFQGTLQFGKEDNDLTLANTMNKWRNKCTAQTTQFGCEWDTVRSSLKTKKEEAKNRCKWIVEPNQFATNETVLNDVQTWVLNPQ